MLGLLTLSPPSGRQGRVRRYLESVWPRDPLSVPVARAAALELAPELAMEPALCTTGTYVLRPGQRLHATDRILCRCRIRHDVADGCGMSLPPRWVARLRTVHRVRGHGSTPLRRHGAARSTAAAGSSWAGPWLATFERLLSLRRALLSQC